MHSERSSRRPSNVFDRQVEIADAYTWDGTVDELVVDTTDKIVPITLAPIASIGRNSRLEIMLRNETNSATIAFTGSEKFIDDETSITLSGTNDRLVILAHVDGDDLSAPFWSYYLILDGGMGGGSRTKGWYDPVESRVLDTPPGSPADGVGYMMPAVPKAAWAAFPPGSLTYWRATLSEWENILPIVLSWVCVKNEGVPEHLGLDLRCLTPFPSITWEAVEHEFQYDDDTPVLYGSASGGNALDVWSTTQTTPALLRAVGNGFTEILTSKANTIRNHRAPSASYPTRYYYSNNNPEAYNGGQEWGAYWHSGAAAIFSHGIGYERHDVAALYDFGKLIFSDQPGTGGAFTVDTTTLQEGAGKQWLLGGSLQSTLVNIKTAFDASAAAADYSCWISGMDTICFRKKIAGVSGLVFSKGTLTNCTATPGAGIFTGGRDAKAGATSHDPDHFFSGIIEVAGVGYFDSDLYLSGTYSVLGGTSILSAVSGSVSQNLNRLSIPAADGDVIATTSWKAMNTAASPALVTYGTLATEVQVPTENLYEAISRWSVCEGGTSPVEYLRADGTSTIKSLVASRNFFIGDDLIQGFGNTAASPDAGLRWSTAQTNDALLLSLGATSRTLIVTDDTGKAVDWGIANKSYPTIVLTGVNAAAPTDYMCMYYDSVNHYAYLDAGAGLVEANLFPNNYVKINYLRAGGITLLDTSSITWGSSVRIREKQDDGAMMFIDFADGYANGNWIISDIANAAYQHTSGTPSLYPTQWLFSRTRPDWSNVEWMSQGHDKSNAIYSVGYGGHQFTSAAQRARGTLTYTGQAIATETVVIDTVTYTFDGVNGWDPAVGADKDASFANLVTKVLAKQAVTVGCWQNTTAGTVTFEWKTAGTAGNSITFTETLTNATIDGGGFLGGTHLGVAAATLLDMDESGLTTVLDFTTTTGHFLNFPDTGAAGAAEGYIKVKVGGVEKRIPYYAVA